MDYDHGGDIYGNPGVELDFSVNTNPLGLPDAVRRALISRVDEFSRYPDPHCRALRAEIARREGVREDWILCGNGAADLIDRLCYAARPCAALVCAPTFSEYERALARTGCAIGRHALSAENGFALTDAVLERISPGVEMLFLCHPNNPTGRLIPPNLLERILNRAHESGTTVVVDECFLDFTHGESAKRYLDEMPKLVILRAFTKMYAMAGLRLGYLLASDDGLIGSIRAAAQCWSVSVPAQIAGVAALGLADWPEKTRLLISTERLFLSEALREMGMTVFPGDANFLLLRSERALYEPLLEKGILIRACGNFCGLDHSYYRIGIKARPDNIRLIRALREIFD